MNNIEVNSLELSDVKKKFDNLIELREEHIDKLDTMLENLRDMKTEGFIEDIVDKLDEHITDVRNVQIANLQYNSDFIDDYQEQLTTLDESTRG